MKKLVSALLLFALFCLIACAACGEETTGLYEYPYTYDVVNGGAVITSFDNGYLGDIVVPDTLGGYPVTGIDDYVFYDAGAYCSITLPDSITSLGYLCLPSASYWLTQFHLPDNITQMEQLVESSADESYSTPFYVSGGSATARSLCATTPYISIIDPAYPEWNFKILGDQRLTATYFYPNTDSTEVTFPPFVQAIDDELFCQTRISKVTLPDALEHIGDNAFAQCRFLHEIHLPDHITSFGESPFDINFQDSVTGELQFLDLYADINSTTAKSLHKTNYGGHPYSFYDASSSNRTWKWHLSASGDLVAGGYTSSSASVSFPENIDGIGSRVFLEYSGEQSIVDINIPEGVRFLEPEAFLDFANVQYISLPNSLTSIGSNAFSDSSVDWIAIPSGVTRIDQPIIGSGFGDSLSYVIIPREVSYLSEDAFGYLYPLVYCYRGSYADEWAQSTEHDIVYIDDAPLKPSLTMMVYTTASIADKHFAVIGDSFFWTDHVYVNPYFSGYPLTRTCVSSNPSVVSIDGCVASCVGAGTSTLTFSLAEYPDVKIKKTVYCYKPIESASFPDTVLIKLGAKRKTMYLTDVKPEGANPYVSLTELDEGGEPWYSTNYAGGKYCVGITPANEPGIKKMRIYFSTASDKENIPYIPFDLVTYETIGSLNVTEPSAPLLTGVLYTPEITLQVDDLTLSSPALYSLSSSNKSVVAPTADGRLDPLKEGTATITATAAVTGEKKTFTVTVKKNTLLDLPDSLTAVADYAFYRTVVSSVSVPEGAVSIGEYAFAENPNLTAVSLPASVTAIADTAFDGCGAITITAPAGSYAQQYALEHGFAFTAQ